MKKLKKMKGARALAAGLALCMMICGVVGGSMAWLIDETAPVTNTFTYGDINIDLEESDSDNDGDPNNNDYEMVPGSDIVKDPTVIVKANSENCYVFVKLVENIVHPDPTLTFNDFLTYEIADGWTELTGVDGVYYRNGYESTEDVEFEVLKNNEVTVKESVTKEMLNSLITYPTLTITAYAVQMENIDNVDDAWAQVPASANP